MPKITEAEFTHLGLNCKVLFLNAGHRCGYVNVSNTRLHGINYSTPLSVAIDPLELSIGKRSPLTFFCFDGHTRSLDILCDVHGGVTYSGSHQDKNSWWIGFDCAHYNDDVDLVALAQHFPNNVPLAIKYRCNPSGKIRTLAYVEEECRNLASQLLTILNSKPYRPSYPHCRNPHQRRFN